MYARSERYYIKQADIETNITVKFIIDATHSMSYGEDSLTKLQYAKVLTAALAYLARKQSDTFGLFAVNDYQLHVVNPRFEQQQFFRFLNELILIKSEGHWNKTSDVEQLFDHRGKEMIIFITDLYDDNEDLPGFISRLKTPRNEVIVFHIMGDREMTLDFEGSFTFQDLEMKTSRRVETMSQKSQYKKRIDDWIAQSRLWMYEKQISYQLVRLNDAFENSLRDFLKVRKLLIR
jgi:uncharacterized protein (DUF58 family)